MKKPHLLILLGMFLIVGLLVAPASAFVAWEWNTYSGYINSPWSMGAEFTANSSFTVTQLGFFDNRGDGLTESHAVGIYDLSGNLLTSTTVTTADPLVGHFRYNPTNPVTLLAGQTYRIAAETGSEAYSWGPTEFSTDPNVTYVSSAFTSSSVLVYPASTDSRIGYFGPNFSTSAVPVPPTMYLLGSGLLGLAGWRRFRKG